VELLAWKLRVSTLWIFLGVGMLALMFAVIMPADVLGQYIATGEFEGEKIDATLLAVMVMLFCLVPLTMAFLTLVLRDPINRYANAILGIGALITVTLIIAGLLIVWHAWSWPKPTGSTV
jgi:hypothetical protein